MEKAEEIIEYWFGDLKPSTPEEGRFDLWFEKSEDTDQEIRERFLEDIERAGKGELDNWNSSPKTSLALIILTDQFTRNAMRNSGKAFELDHLAREVAREGIEKGYDRELPLLARLFYYLPFEHSEDLADQEKSVDLFKSLKDESPAEMSETFSMVYDYAVRHHEIVSRFGRFPHRNEVLGRELTNEEIEFLKEPNSSF
jgi:uncharacterized protein (DUF924 family)